MAFRNHLILALLVPSLAAGCVLPTAKKLPGQTTGAEGTLRGGLKPASRPGATPAPTIGNRLNPPAGAGLISNNGGGIISNNAGSLSGVVRAPSNLISNNGGSIISNNSGGYRVRRFRVLSSVTEVAVAKIPVTLVDANGTPIKGADGAPITTTTDENGRYTFKGILPANNLIVAVTLPDNKGVLKAIAPKGGGETRKADLNLISTLTTGYIVSQYVNTQSDKQKTLDKLPADVESATRAKAAAAFNNSGAQVPPSLSEANVVQTVTTLRQQNEAFNVQMEDVKKLLVAAGQSDLGNGRPALEVTLNYVDHLLLDGAGQLLIACNEDRRLWRINAQAQLVTAVGKGGSASLASPNGVNGPDAALGAFANVTTDAQGRALILEASLNNEDAAFPDAGRLTRLGTDGKLTELAASIPDAHMAVPGAGDEVLVLTYKWSDDEDEIATFELWSVRPGAAPVKKVTFSDTDAETLDSCDKIAGDGQGRLFFVPYGVYDEATETDTTTLYKLEPGATQLTRVGSLGTDVDCVFDAKGNLFLWNYQTDSIAVRKVDGTTATVLSNTNAFGGGGLDAAVLAADGTAYVSWGAKVYKVVANQATAIAGTGEEQAEGTATTVAVQPDGLAVGPNGDLYFAGVMNSAIYRIGADKQVKQFAGVSSVPDDHEEEKPIVHTGPALTVELTFPTHVQTDAAGNVYFSDSAGNWEDDEYIEYQRVCKVDAAGNLTEAATFTGEDDEIAALAVAPDGTMYMAVVTEVYDEANEDADPVRTVRLVRKAPGQAAVTLKTDTDPDLEYALAATNDGLFLARTAPGDSGELCRWTAAKGIEPLKTDAHFIPWAITMAVDKANRVYLADSDRDRIYRYDVAAQTFTTVAGKGSANFSGASVDTSIDAPSFPCFDKDGNLFFADTGHRQIKQVPAGDL